MNVVCPSCNTFQWAQEVNLFQTCCRSGAVDMFPLQQPPVEMIKMLTGDSHADYLESVPSSASPMITIGAKVETDEVIRLFVVSGSVWGTGGNRTVKLGIYLPSTPCFAKVPFRSYEFSRVGLLWGDQVHPSTWTRESRPFLELKLTGLEYMWGLKLSFYKGKSSDRLSGGPGDMFTQGNETLPISEHMSRFIPTTLGAGVSAKDEPFDQAREGSGILQKQLTEPPRKRRRPLSSGRLLAGTERGNMAGTWRSELRGFPSTRHPSNKLSGADKPRWGIVYGGQATESSRKKVALRTKSGNGFDLEGKVRAFAQKRLPDFQEAKAPDIDKYGNIGHSTLAEACPSSPSSPTPKTPLGTSASYSVQPFSHPAPEAHLSQGKGKARESTPSSADGSAGDDGFQPYSEDVRPRDVDSLIQPDASTSGGWPKPTDSPLLDRSSPDLLTPPPPVSFSPAPRSHPFSPSRKPFVLTRRQLRVLSESEEEEEVSREVIERDDEDVVFQGRGRKGAILNEDER
ncbi:hypothetical protein IAR50_006808 [Cryptococcus sp. DSM 104548]